MAQARKVVFVSEVMRLKVPTLGRTYQKKYTLQNHSDEPISHHVYTPDGFKDQDPSDAKLVLPPGDLHTCVESGFDNDLPITVTFRNSSGLGCVHDVAGEVHPDRKYNSYRKRRKRSKRY